MGASGGAGPVGSRLKAVNVVKAIPKGGSDLERLLSFQIRAAGLPTPEREVRFDPARKWRFDFAWRDRMLAVEVEGGTWTRGAHNRGRGMEEDCEKYNAAVAKGWALLRFTNHMIEDGRAIKIITAMLQTAASDGSSGRINP